MGFWSGLGKIGMGIAGLAGAPFTGGATLAALPGLLSGGADIVGGIAGNRAKGKLLDAQTAGQTTSTNNQALLDQFRSQMEAGKYGMSMASGRADQARMGDILANVQDVHADHPRANVVHFSGGLRPSLFGPNTRSAGQSLSNMGASQIGKDQVTAPTMGMAPGIAPSGILDKILGVAGPALSIGSLFANQQQPKPQAPGRSGLLPGGPGSLPSNSLFPRY